MSTSLDSITHRHVRIDGRSVHCAILGEGRPVLLIPGWPQTWYEWRHTIAALAPRYTVIAPDMRGYGRSTVHPEPQDYAVEHSVHDLMALLDALGERFAAAIEVRQRGTASSARRREPVSEAALSNPWLRRWETACAISKVRKAPSRRSR